MSGTHVAQWGGRILAVAALAGMVGCGQPPPAAPVETGAKAAAQAYFEGIIHKDWAAAYGTLAADSKARVSAEKFARLGEDYRRGLGFEPQAVHIGDCEENGDRAVAHVTLSGKGVHRHRFKDAVTLRKGDTGWVVVLSTTFGRTVRPPG
ncbi:hypothetical protein [Limnoglobus roseus]|uniref:Nuclear transport factor 2 family protein n=1 Tax=Limnoglobus roseus TaxID=2598579 RepID=A0A5C1A8I6_9BACT|nr:hypothetical protein [Limnoglobus roseus]QEL14082.1 hypothetical protein PX52LOC_00946 [Limnoglobus roseus]